jgi:hypothetical protein
VGLGDHIDNIEVGRTLGRMVDTSIFILFLGLVTVALFEALGGHEMSDAFYVNLIIIFSTGVVGYLIGRERKHIKLIDENHRLRATNAEYLQTIKRHNAVEFKDSEVKNGDERQSG